MNSRQYKTPSFPRRRTKSAGSGFRTAEGWPVRAQTRDGFRKSILPRVDSRLRGNDDSGRAVDVGNRGFTLLEVLVALTVLGISFMAVLGTAGQAISSSAHLRDKTFAHWVGMNVIAEQRISGVWPDTGTSDGEVQMANREWTWEMEVSETAAEHLRRIEVRVFFEDKPDDALALVTGFIGEPQILMGLPGNRNRNGENGEGREPPPGSLEPGSDTPPDKDP